MAFGGKTKYFVMCLLIDRVALCLRSPKMQTECITYRLRFSWYLPFSKLQKYRSVPACAQSLDQTARTRCYVWRACAAMTRAATHALWRAPHRQHHHLRMLYCMLLRVSSLVFSSQDDRYNSIRVFRSIYN